MPLDALLNRLALPLSERNGKVHHQFAHRRGGVDERLRNRREPHAQLLHLLVELAEVLRASRHAVNSENDDLVDLALFAFRDQPLVGWAVKIAPAVAVIVIAIRQGDPPLGGLRSDEALAHLPLGID